jgi:GTPase Era involved in 16S rRNA processing
MFLGLTKAGKTTLINRLIGKNILPTSQMRTILCKWTVSFHNNSKFKL